MHICVCRSFIWYRSHTGWLQMLSTSLKPSLFSLTAPCRYSQPAAATSIPRFGRQRRVKWKLKGLLIAILVASSLNSDEFRQGIVDFQGVLRCSALLFHSVTWPGAIAEPSDGPGVHERWIRLQMPSFSLPYDLLSHSFASKWIKYTIYTMKIRI